MSAPSLRCISFNIWSDYRSPQSWLLRRDVVASIVQYHRPDLLGLQEAQRGMIDDLAERLDGYAWVGRGRESDGSGEFNPIFYRRDRLNLLAHDTFWISPKNAPGRSWDAACPRIATWARLRDTSTGAKWVLFNTHLDHFGRRARREGASLLLQKIQDIAGGEHVIVTGDFNCRETSATYAILSTGGGDPVLALQDAKTASVSGHHGPRKTWRGALAGLVGSSRIDFIFVKNGVSVLTHATLASEWNGRIGSDHAPVLAEVSGGAD